MDKRFCCAFCGVELERMYCHCPHCDSTSVGYVDSVGGWHENGSSTMPDGTECGECISEDCGSCEVWKLHQIQRQCYGKWRCEECGHELEIWLDQIEEERPAESDGFKYERHLLMWHCAECGCDYESYWETQFGDFIESKPKRKIWGQHYEYPNKN